MWDQEKDTFFRKVGDITAYLYAEGNRPIDSKKRKKKVMMVQESKKSVGTLLE